MPVNNNYEINEYTGNSSGRSFNFPFRCFSLDHLVVELIDADDNVTTLVKDTDYTVTGGLDNSGGSITYPKSTSQDALSSSETLRIYRSTPMEQSIDYPVYQQAIENALDKTTMLLQEAVNDSAVSIANDAVETANDAVKTVNEAVDSIANKVDGDGTGITDRLAFLTKLGITSDGDVDLSDVAYTSGDNIDVESYRSLLGLIDIEDDITGLEAEASSIGSTIVTIDSRVTELEDNPALCYAPQTIIAGATGDLPDGWTLEDCDAPAAHIFSSGTSELTIVAGLQVAAGYEGQVYISDVLAADTTLDISDLINATDGTGWIYSDIGTDGSQSFGYTENQPQVGIQKNDYSDFVPTLSANTDKGFIVSISSSYSTEYPPYKGYDGVITQNTGVITSSSAYSSLIGNESMYIELESGEAFETNGIMLMPYAVSSVLYGMPANFTIDGSDDGGENWTNVFTATGITDWKLQTYKCFTWDKVSYRKYRINCTKLAFSTYFALTEIKWLQPLSCDFFNIAKQTHYNANGNAIRRVYIGSVTVTAGVIDEIINFQHGTEYTEIINDYKNVTINAIYYPKKRYLGSCYPTARVYVESHWGRTGFFCYSGFSAGVRVWSTGESLSVHTAITYLTHVRSTNLATFTTYVTSAPCKITVKRGY